MTEHHQSPSWVKARNTAKPRITARLPAPCIDCGAPVLPTQAWDVGHIISASKGKSMGWTEAQINSQTNLGPSHVKCNRSAGGRMGAAKTNKSKTNTEDRRLLPW